DIIKLILLSKNIKFTNLSQFYSQILCLTKLFIQYL
ncbi:MAG: hypothetical protein PWQ14_1216, partial [Rikenellaceae bacterium]|nr:hypothetical protein [Rikenellaceae bacterium]